MVKAKDDIKRETYSVRLDPLIINKVKHLAVDEKKTVSQVIEDAILLLLSSGRTN